MHHTDPCNAWTAVVEQARADGLAALAVEIIDSPRRKAIVERARVRLGVSEETLARKMEFVTAQGTPAPEKI